MSTIRSKKDRSARFVQLFSSMLEDPNLSLKAKGFIGYCMSKPEDWTFYIKQLASVLKEKERSIESAVNECIRLGYAIRFQKRKENGDFAPWETIISDSKEEIRLLIEEMKFTGEFQKIITVGRFAVAQNDPLLIKKETKKDIYIKPPTKPSSKTSKTNPLKNSVGGFFEFLKEVKISEKDKVRLSAQYPEALLNKVIEYVSRPQFQPKGGLDKAIFYFCKNPDHMTESQEEKQFKEQRSNEQKQDKIEHRKQSASLLEKYCRMYLKQRSRDITIVRWSQEYIEFGSGDNQCKIYYKYGGFKDQIEKNLKSHEIEIPGWIKDIP